MRQLFIILITLSTGVLILAAFIDLELSINVVNQTDPVAIWVARYGEIPALILLLFALLIRSAKLSVVNRAKSLMLHLFVVLLTMLLLFLIVEKSIFANENLPLVSRLNLVYCFILCGISVLLILGLRRGLSGLGPRFDLLAKWAIFQGLWVPLIAVQSLKQMWGRVRFRDLGIDFSQFTLWFQPQGPSGDLSFPSGHTAMGWMLLPLIFLIIDGNSLIEGWLPKLLLLFIISYGVFVASFRIVAGAHYLSDVGFSSLLSFVLFFIAIRKNRSDSL